MNTTGVFSALVCFYGASSKRAARTKKWASTNKERLTHEHESYTKELANFTQIVASLQACDDNGGVPRENFGA